MKNLAITGGGTGGHIYAGIALAQQHLKKNPSMNSVVFIGSALGLETKLVPKENIKLETLPIGRFVGQSKLRKLITLLQLPIAVLKAAYLLRKYKTDTVLGVGGFASAPCILGAKLLGLNIGVLEQNAIMGLTNRLCAALAHRVFLAFPDTPKSLDSKKCTFTGNPTRSQLNAQKTTKPQAEVFTIFIFGGSQGASGINKLIPAASELLINQGHKIKIIHQTGPKDFESVRKAYEDRHIEAQVHDFIYDMQNKYNECDLVICRAGSGTISELEATGNASILIPFPAAAGNHQYFNALSLQSQGAALLLEEKDTSPQKLAASISALIKEPQNLENMRKKVLSLHRPHATQEILGTMANIFE